MHNTKLNTNKSKKSNPENLKPKKLALDPHQHKIKHEQIWKIKPPHHQSIKHKTQTQNFWPPNTKTLNSTPKILGTKENRRKERVWFSYLSEKPTQNQLKPTQNSTIWNPTINDPSIWNSAINDPSIWNPTIWNSTQTTDPKPPNPPGPPPLISTFVSLQGTQAETPQASILRCWPRQPWTIVSPFWAWSMGFPFVIMFLCVIVQNELDLNLCILLFLIMFFLFLFS